MLVFRGDWGTESFELLVGGGKLTPSNQQFVAESVWGIRMLVFKGDRGTKYFDYVPPPTKSTNNTVTQSPLNTSIIIPHTLSDTKSFVPHPPPATSKYVPQEVQGTRT